MSKPTATIEQIAEAIGCQKRAAEMRAKRESWAYTEKAVRGGRKRCYEVDALPEDIQPKVLMQLVNLGEVLPKEQSQVEAEGETLKAPRPKKSNSYDRDSLWAWYDSRPQSIKDEGNRRAGFCLKVRALLDAGLRISPALQEVARADQIPLATLKRWWYGDATILGAAAADRSDYAAALAPRYPGGQQTAEMSSEAWEMIKADWLRPEKPSVAAVYRRAQRAAKERGWTLPSQATVMRRLEALPWQVRVLAREGEDGLKARLGHMTRLKSNLHALEAVNADGHVFDVRVTLPSPGPDGKPRVGRPVLVAWQDIYSGKVLAYRVGETLNQHLVRLAFGDLVEQYGVPHHVYLDNGREFANKWMTGGTRTRFRFKIKEDDPIGIFALLGIETHWTTPYHGQAKPIERAFSDLCCENIAKHPACSGAYTGNSPSNKPSNYGERAMDWDEFLAVVDEAIAEHNARTGRRTLVCANQKSFEQAFAESYAQSAIRKATAEQRRLWLLAAEGVTVRKTGHVVIETNWYYGEEVAAYVGKKVIVRFDSANLMRPVFVYDLSGTFIGEASVTQANFNDTEAAKNHSRARTKKQRAAKEKLEAELTMDAIEVAQRLPKIVPMEKPKTSTVTPLFNQLRVANGGLEDEDDGLSSDERYIQGMMGSLTQIRRIRD